MNNVFDTNKATEQKTTTSDYEYLRIAQSILSEWESVYDEKAFAHLQRKHFVLGKYGIN